MPLLGKLTANTIPKLLETAARTTSDAVLHVVSPEHEGSITFEKGEITHVQEKHRNTRLTLTSLTQLQTGHFLLYQQGEALYKDEHDSTPPIWLLDSDTERCHELHQSLQSLGFSVCVLFDEEHLFALLKQLTPKLLLLDAEFAQRYQNPLLDQIKSNPQPAKLMLIGSVAVDSPALEEIGAEPLSWPITRMELQQRIETWHPHVHSSISEQNAQEVLNVLSHFTPNTYDQHVQCSPAQKEQLERLQFDPGWTKWLTSLDRKYPIHHYLQLCPGPQEYGRILIHQLLQAGLLTTQNVTNEIDAFMDDLEEAPPPLQLHKIIVIGLQGKWKQDWIQSLKKISQNQSARIPREHPFPVTHMPKSEHARIPLHRDTLLVVYGARNEENIDQIVAQTNPHITGFLYFVELDNPEEVEHIRFMRQSLEARFPSRHLYMVRTERERSTEELQRELRAPNDRLFVSLQHFDLHSTHSALQTLLQSFSS